MRLPSVSVLLRLLKRYLLLRTIQANSLAQGQENMQLAKGFGDYEVQTLCLEIGH
jgi:hypothetical protein